MKITGIICEYNPLHLGHKLQLDHVKATGSHIVCLMSGNFVQRGHPAVFDKMYRAEAALRCGADLVLELPITAALSSAEGFASEGVRILSCMCDTLSFGSETGSLQPLMAAATALLSEEFRKTLLSELEAGVSFPAARQKALQRLGIDMAALTRPNDILAVEYCKALLAQGSPMVPAPLQRNGDYHAMIPDSQEPSATAIRSCIENAAPWQQLIPAEAAPIFANATVHTLRAGERAMLARLRTMSEDEYETLPFGSEGLWRKVMRSVFSAADIDSILAASKSKRYTYTRLSRMLMCAYLGISADTLAQQAPYVRVLGFTNNGREILKKARCNGEFINIGEKTGHPYEALEKRCEDLYGLFAQDAPEVAGTHSRRRVIYWDN